MKRAIALICCACLLLASCGQPQVLGNGVLYPTYGLLNEKSAKSKDVCYEISFGNIVWSIILVETIIFPVYFIGWSLYNPIRLKKDAHDDCSFSG